MHYWVTVRNSGAPLTIKRWVLTLDIPGKGTLTFSPTRAASDNVTRADGRKFKAPFNSQDLTDRIDAVTKERPAAGILNFALNGVSKEEVVRKEVVGKLICFDEHEQSYSSPFIRFARLC